jgi:hypothetical protein
MCHWNGKYFWIAAVKVYFFSVLVVLGALCLGLQFTNMVKAETCCPASFDAFPMLFGILVELGLIYRLFLLIGIRRWWQRIPIYLMFLITILFYLGQSIALLISGELISALAISNITLIHLLPISSRQYILIAALILGPTIILAVLLERAVRQNGFAEASLDVRLTHNGPIVLVLALVLLCSDIYYLFPPGKLSFPAVNLIRNLGEAYSAKQVLIFKRDDAAEAALDRQFFKAKVFNEPLNLPVYFSKHKPNVIVFFVEGLPARLVSYYGSIFSGITPNTDRFAKNPHCMQVKNYYNHTAATFRAISTQHNSGFTTTEYEFDKKRDLPNVASILRERGYETYFFYSQNHPELYNMAVYLHFENIFTAERITTKLLKNDGHNLPLGITDKGLLTGLINFLKTRQDSGKPFYLALYNFQIHAFMRSPNGENPYPNEKNTMLDRVHNWDRQFGMFYDYFKKSPYANNTIFILTADHTAYSGDPGYRQLDQKYNFKVPWFVDMIPLIVYDPLRQLPKSFDAKMATSTSFAPTLLHLLGIQNVENYFFGESIFERESEVGIASIDHTKKFYIYQNAVLSGEPLPHIREEVKAQWKRIDDYYDFHIKRTRK